MIINKRQGFIRSETLLIIVLIGILVGVVMSALAIARNKSRDVQIASDVERVRSTLETLYNGAFYPNLTGEVATKNVLASGFPSEIGKLLDDASSQGGGVKIFIDTDLNGSAVSYAIYGQLVSSLFTSYYCIDSAGKKNSSARVLNPSSATCP